MTVIKEPKRRFVNSPTVFMEYEKDKEGFDNFLAKDSKMVPDYTEREEKKDETKEDDVDGSESLRSRLDNYFGVVHASKQVSGSESFVGSIKEGFAKLIKKIKDFFKWMWEYFTSRGSRLDKKMATLQAAIKGNGIKEDTEIGYPINAGRIYTLPRNKKPLNNLSWLDADLSRLEKLVKGTKEFNTKAEELLRTVVKKDLKPGDASEKIYKVALSAFDVKEGKDESVLNIFGNFQLVFRPTDKFLSVTTLSGVPTGSKFRTNLNSVKSYADRLDEVIKQYTKNINDAKKLESTVIKELNDLAKSDETAGNQKANQDAVRNVITRVMEAIRQTNDLAYRGSQATVDILSATTK